MHRDPFHQYVIPLDFHGHPLADEYAAPFAPHHEHLTCLLPYVLDALYTHSLQKY